MHFRRSWVGKRSRESEKKRKREKGRNDEAFFAKPSREIEGTVQSSLDGRLDLARRRYGAGGMYVSIHTYIHNERERERGVTCIPKILRNNIRGKGETNVR